VAQDADLTFAETVGQTGAVLVRSRGRDIATLMQAYQARQDVLYVEPNYIWQALDILTTSSSATVWLDERGSDTEDFVPSTSGTAGADISARQADITEGSRHRRKRGRHRRRLYASRSGSQHVVGSRPFT
jgi:hypothetical protein